MPARLFLMSGQAYRLNVSWLPGQPARLKVAQDAGLDTQFSLRSKRRWPLIVKGAKPARRLSTKGLNEGPRSGILGKRRGLAREQHRHLSIASGPKRSCEAHLGRERHRFGPRGNEIGSE